MLTMKNRICLADVPNPSQGKVPADQTLAVRLCKGIRTNPHRRRQQVNVCLGLKLQAVFRLAAMLRYHFDRLTLLTSFLEHCIAARPRRST
jgi:hypothetical protein